MMIIIVAMIIRILMHIITLIIVGPTIEEIMITTAQQ